MVSKFEIDDCSEKGYCIQILVKVELSQTLSCFPVFPRCPNCSQTATCVVFARRDENLATFLTKNLIHWIRAIPNRILVSHVKERNVAQVQPHLYSFKFLKIKFIFDALNVSSWQQPITQRTFLRLNSCLMP